MTDPRTLTISVIEDDPETRLGLSELLSLTPGFRVLELFGSVEQALDSKASASPDVILLDVNLPGMRGDHGVAPLRRKHPKTSILMLSMYDGDDEVFTAICNGASGYVLKRTPPSRLLDAIREAAEDGAPMSPSVARKVLRLFRETLPPAPEKHDLSPHEVRVVKLLAEGHTYEAAGAELNVTVNTIRSYVRSIYEKLEVHSKSEAVSKALRSGII
ncbi:MAG: response regulator transcription factor [Acidobacteriota bacterium]